MAYIEQLYTDLTAAIAAEWPSVLANGIWQAEHIEQVPWADLTPPFAVIIIPPVQLAEEWGVTNDIYLANVTLVYTAITTGDSTDQRSKLETLRDYLLHTGLPNEIVLQCEIMDWADDSEPNAIFKMKNYAHRAGRLVCEILIGQTQP